MKLSAQNPSRSLHRCRPGRGADGDGVLIQLEWHQDARPRYLLTDVLKGELGFTGFIVSDWGGIDQVSDDYYQAVVTAINAGIDMSMVPQDYERFISHLRQAVEKGDIPLKRIDDAVRRILSVKCKAGLFERPHPDPRHLTLVGSAQHRELAREAVARSLVLLKNEAQTLPLPKDTPMILVGGPAADDIGLQCGGWTIEWLGKPGAITPGTTILSGIGQPSPPQPGLSMTQTENSSSYQIKWQSLGLPFCLKCPMQKVLATRPT